MRKTFWGSNASEGEEEITETQSQSFIEVIDNHIYFYSDIYRDKALQLNREIRRLSGDLLVEEKRRDQEFVVPIYLHIYSYGGLLTAGTSIMDEILNSKVPIYTIVDGCCASAATLLSLVGKKRFIKKNSLMLIHQMSSGMWGKYEEFKDEIENLNLMMEMIKNIYKTYSKIPEGVMEDILKHDLWLNSKTCLEYGLVDEIL